MSGTSGTIPYQAKKYPLEDFGRKCTASQCEHFFLRGSALIMTVPDCVTERGYISEGKTPKNDLTSFNVRNICVLSMFILKSVVNDREASAQTELSYSR